MNILALILFSLVWFGPLLSYAEELVLEEKAWELWEEEKLTVRDNFPQYKKTFNPKTIQEQVYKEFLQEEEKTKEPKS